ncbi:ATP-binding protein [Altererythrobacter sp. TH136]|uniref:ATP-binding protein n=1 Tax=Altererythrobacter sp. TH136 TaxID=2067415 RepID=UPI0011652F60|nr:ATP-binding protein [Altererythrobacter sp. TH136]QDM41803.1 hypothetical protein C0V74_12705 [Altererythrobacter sp. TH136]
MILLLGWIALLTRVDSERESAESAAITRAKDRATLLEQHVVKTLQVASLASLHLGDMHFGASAEHRKAQTNTRWIEDEAIGIAGFSGATVANATGQIVATAGGPAPRREDLAELKLDLVEGPDVTIGRPQPLGETDQQYVLVVRRIKTNGSVAGFVALSLRPEQFLNFPIRTRFEVTDLVSVINLDGVTLARREGDRFSSGENVRGRLVMREQQRNPNGTYKGPSSLDGHVRYFSHRRLEDFPIFVTAGVSYSAALVNAQRRAMIYFIIMTVLSGACLLTAWIIQREASYREKNSAELAGSRKRLQEAQRVAKIGDWEYDLSRNLVTWSDQLCEMYERSLEDDHLTLEDFAAYVHPDDISQFEKDFQILLGKADHHSYEFRVILPSGKILCRHINAIATTDEAGQIISLYGTDQDVTHLQLLRELENHVAHLDRQGAMSMMAGTLAHELNQPLTAASNYLTGSLRNAEKANEYQGKTVLPGMKLALDQIHDAAEIIRRVRRMVQVEDRETKIASLRACVSDAVALLQASGYSEAKEIQIKVDPDTPEALIAPIQLQQVLVNLLKNALEAVHNDVPAVSVRASCTDQKMLRIEVWDNGPGFPATASDVFSAFYSEKSSGTGLGLSISRTIIEYHSGKIYVGESGPGKTVIVILLPMAPPDAEAA